MFRNFSKIWIVIAVAVFAFAGIFCWQYFDTQKENENIETEESEEQVEEQEKIVYGRIVELKSWLREGFGQKIIFYNSGKNEIINEIDDEKILRELTEILGLSFSLLKEVRLCDYAIERPLGVFYFFAGNGTECGKNCAWFLFQYDSGMPKLSYIGDLEKDEEYSPVLFGGNVSSYYFSPDNSKIIVSAIGSGGLCYVGEDMGIIDFEQSNFRRIPKFDDYDKYSMHEIESLNWLGNDSLEFSLLERNCGKDENMKRVRYYKYYFSQDKLELVKEEFQELDEREQNRF